MLRLDDLDGSLALARDGYRYIARRRRDAGADIVDDRLFGIPVTLLGGRAGAELFYDSDRFQRSGALPGPVLKTLFGIGGVQALDDDVHLARKAMFGESLAAAGVDALAASFTAELRSAARAWTSAGEVTLFDAVAEPLCAAVCRWVGLAMPPEDVPDRAAALVAMVEGLGSLGGRHWRARWHRLQMERWIAKVIEDLRRQGTDDRSTPLGVISSHVEADGALLDARTAAIEVINVIRPTTAIAWFVAFIAHAFETEPAWRSRVATGGVDEVLNFVHEVRRFYPFAPFIAARSRDELSWQGVEIPQGRLTLLDLYGIDHDADMWSHPEAFDPDRFIGRTIGPFDLVPQGGGDTWSGHRCAGEQITIELMAVAARFLASEVDYRVPSQDLSISLRRFPTLPRSRMVLSNIATVSTSSSSKVAATTSS